MGLANLDRVTVVGASDHAGALMPATRGKNRIFKVFQRLNARERFEGTGVGLAICRRIAERLGVSIAVVSVPGAGSTFTVALPDAAE